MILIGLQQFNKQVNIKLTYILETILSISAQFIFLFQIAEHLRVSKLYSVLFLNDSVVLNESFERLSHKDL